MSYHGGRLGAEPVDQQHSRDIVGQVGDDPGAFAIQKRTRIERHRVVIDDGQTARIALFDFFSAGIARSSRSTAITRLRPAPARRVRPPGPGPISTIVASSSGAAARAIRDVRLRSSRKFWPSDLRGQLEAPDHVAERRQIVDRAHVFEAAIRAARRSAAIRLEGWRVRCRDIEGRAVIRRWADER
jgi:hypothetical protein